MRRLIAAIGRSFVTVGLLILLFVAYQLWGTGLYTAQQQDKLRTQFEHALHLSTPPSTSPPTTTVVTRPDTASSTTTTTQPAPLPPPVGGAVAQIRIPSIGVDDIVVNGTSRDDLRKGPGHYPDTPLPGETGNAAIAGHRTTYGAPFGRLDELSIGDLILFRTLTGTYTYEVYETPFAVQPNDVTVLKNNPLRPAILTLTTCTPKYSAAQRLIVHAALKEKPLPAPVIKHKPRLTVVGLSGEQSSKTPTVIAGFIAALVGLLWWLLFHRHPRWTTWLIGALPFAVTLFFFYSYLERILPSNY